MVERTAEYWLKKAEEARNRASQMHNPDARETMLDIAQKYNLMAQRAEDKDARFRTKSGSPDL